MKLQHLKYEKCPHCGARLVSELQRSLAEAAERGNSDPFLDHEWWVAPLHNMDDRQEDEE